MCDIEVPKRGRARERTAASTRVGGRSKGELVVTASVSSNRHLSHPNADVGGLGPVTELHANRLIRADVRHSHRVASVLMLTGCDVRTGARSGAVHPITGPLCGDSRGQNRCSSCEGDDERDEDRKERPF